MILLKEIITSIKDQFYGILILISLWSVEAIMRNRTNDLFKPYISSIRKENVASDINFINSNSSNNLFNWHKRMQNINQRRLSVKVSLPKTYL
jgi:hypothetical protein